MGERTKCEELTALKGLMREKKMTYRKLGETIGMSINTLCNKLNGYTPFNATEMRQIIEILGMKEHQIFKYFFPELLRHETKKGDQSW